MKSRSGNDEVFMPNVMDFKCPSCGGPIVFDSTVQKMKCTYCGTEYEQSILEQYEDALKHMPKEDKFSWNVETDSHWQDGDADLAVYVCQSCGGQIVGDPTTMATNCPYCDNPVVLSDKITGDLKPSFLIPFQLTKEQAMEAFRNHIKGKRLLPKDFSKENHIQKIKGLYVPFWLFDAEADGSMRYLGKRIRTWSDSKNNYTETSYFSVLRTGHVCFDKVPVDAASKMPDDLMQSIEPFDVSKLTPFNPGYLSGYLADRYDENADQCIMKANQRIEESTSQILEETVSGYSSISKESSSVQLNNSVAKYVLYPVWILNSKYKGKDYIFAMNGQTGRFIGDLPLDKAAKNRWLGLIFLLSFILLYGGAWLIHFLL